jgi:hypothetical protein
MFDLLEADSYAPRMLAILPLLCPNVVLAQEAPTADPLGQALDAALEAYFAGDLTSARAGLRRLVRQPTFSQHPDREKAFLALAEVEYYLGERDSSWATCVELLAINANYKIDPFVHPPEIVAFFESVRSTLTQQTPQPPSPKPQGVPPWAVLLPGGIQLYNDQQSIGTVTLGAIGVLSATSTSLFIALRRYDLNRDRPGIQVATFEDQQQAEQLLRWTNGTRWAVAGLWSASLVHGLFSSTGSRGGTPIRYSPTGLHFEWHWP